MSVDVSVPANFVSAGWGTPSVCARHGEPAVVTSKTRFVSRTSSWLVLLGVIIYFVVMAATRKTVWSPAWPFCARCRKEETTKTLAGWGGLVVGLVIWVGSVQILGSRAPIGAITGCVLFIGGVILIGRGTRVAIAGGVVTGDGLTVRFARAHEEFANQVALAAQAAARHHAAQSGYPAQPAGYPAQPGAFATEQPPAAV